MEKDVCADFDTILVCLHTRKLKGGSFEMYIKAGLTLFFYKTSSLPKCGPTCKFDEETLCIECSHNGQFMVS